MGIDRYEGLGEDSQGEGTLFIRCHDHRQAATVGSDLGQVDAEFLGVGA